MLCCWVEDPNSEAFKLHLPRLQDYMWVAEDGMKMKVCKYHFLVLIFEIWGFLNVLPLLYWYYSFITFVFLVSDDILIIIL